MDTSRTTDRTGATYTATSDASGGSAPPAQSRTIDEVLAEDTRTLHSFGYAQELLRRMSGFSNFAISFSIICILAGGLTSFALGFNSVGGAAIGLGWPLSCLFSLFFAMAMGQVASAFPTAGGLYHWGSILGGKGWGWLTAWFNLVGLVTVLAAINIGAYQFAAGSLGPLTGIPPEKWLSLPYQVTGMLIITFVQALFNHLGIRTTTRLTDFSGYLIFVVSIALTLALVIYASSHDFSRLVSFTNNSGDAGGGVWPQTGNMTYLFFLGLLLPAYTITGFDASAHTSEETIDASRSSPRGIVNSVLYSAIFGYIMLVAIVLAVPDMAAAAKQGFNVFFWTMDNTLPAPLKMTLYAGIVLAQFLCGLATVTSASRMFFAFARDGGLPFSRQLRSISPTHRTPNVAIWTVFALAVLFTIYTPVYSTITVICVIFLYVSYLIPIALGLFAYQRTWTKMGPWTIGRWYRPITALCILGCAGIIYIGVQPPNDKALTVTVAALVLTAVVWFGWERRRFQGPPQGVMIQQRQAEIQAAERAVGQIA
jgi:amino acid transporter